MACPEISCNYIWLSSYLIRRVCFETRVWRYVLNVVTWSQKPCQYNRQEAWGPHNMIWLTDAEISGPALTWTKRLICCILHRWDVIYSMNCRYSSPILIQHLSKSRPMYSLWLPRIFLMSKYIIKVMAWQQTPWLVWASMVEHYFVNYDMRITQFEETSPHLR